MRMGLRDIDRRESIYILEEAGGVPSYSGNRGQQTSLCREMLRMFFSFDHHIA
jgi:hypothetical protein